MTDAPPPPADAPPPPPAPDPRTLVLGDPRDAHLEERLRGGALVVRSRHGLRPTERLLIEALPERAPARLLTGLDGEGIVAAAARRLWGDACAVTWWHVDAYQAARARRTLAGNGVEGVDVVVAPDVPGVVVPGEPAPAPAAPYDLAALPFPRGGEAVFAREVLEEAHAALAPGARLLAAVDDPTAEWLKKVVREVLGGATVALDGRTVGPRKLGLVLGAKRARARAEVRDHRHPMTVTLRGKALRLESRPGVFGHTGLDAGTRALAEVFDLGEADAVLDLGCGYGPLGVVAALGAPRGRAVLVDANVRATTLSARNAAANGAGNVEVRLRADLEGLEPGAYDLVLANPPYFSNFRIARAFVDAAFASLRPGGRAWLVAKAARQHADLLGEAGFGAVEVQEGPKGHGLLRAVRP